MPKKKKEWTPAPQSYTMGKTFKDLEERQPINWVKPVAVVAIILNIVSLLAVWQVFTMIPEVPEYTEPTVKVPSGDGQTVDIPITQATQTLIGIELQRQTQVQQVPQETN